MGFAQPHPELQPWTVTARNLPEHARNAIHTDSGAQAAGYPRALVAGVTTYAYLTHPVVVAWGERWLTRGGGEVRFRRPVFDGDEIMCRASQSTTQTVADVLDVSAVVGAYIHDADAPPVGAGVADVARATFAVARDGGPPPALRPGEALPTTRVELVGRRGSDFAAPAGDDLALYERLGLVHPAVWPALANDIVHEHVARGAWIHTRSIIRHHGPARVGATAEVRATVVRRYERHGERAVLDVLIEVDGHPIASLEHEAIVALP